KPSPPAAPGWKKPSTRWLSSPASFASWRGGDPPNPPHSRCGARRSIAPPGGRRPPRASRLPRYTGDVVYTVDGADGAQDVAQVLGVAHLEREAADRNPVPAGRDRGGQDVDV